MKEVKLCLLAESFLTCSVCQMVHGNTLVIWTYGLPKNLNRYLCKKKQFMNLVLKCLIGFCCYLRLSSYLVYMCLYQSQWSKSTPKHVTHLCLRHHQTRSYDSKTSLKDDNWSFREAKWLWPNPQHHQCFPEESLIQ